MQKALFAGTFDPPTLGHIELIKRASKLTSQLVVGIGHNPRKDQPLLSVGQRLAALKAACQGLPNVEVLPFSGLVTAFAKELGASVLIRGLRTQNDLNTEIEMANANAQLGEIETLFLVADPKFAPISSTLIRELVYFGAPLTAYIPEDVADILKHQKEQQ